MTNDIMSLPLYIGRRAECGCITAVCVDDPKHRKDTIRFVKDVMASGRDVQHITAEQWTDMKKDFRVCPHKGTRTPTRSDKSCQSNLKL